MDNDKKFPEQTAPEKNTDNAYVQVGEDGLPVIPTDKDNTADSIKEDGDTTGDKL